MGSVIPVPFIDVTTLANYFDSVLSSTILGLYNAMSGSAFSRATVFALGIQPYINASIIIELLTIAIPALERLAKEDGEEGRKKIQNITRYTSFLKSASCSKEQKARDQTSLNKFTALADTYFTILKENTA